MLKGYIMAQYSRALLLLQPQNIHVGYKVLTAMTMKNIMFWGVTPCSPVKVHRRFGGTYYIFRFAE
jgi:hypothetical protein